MKRKIIIILIFSVILILIAARYFIFNYYNNFDYNKITYENCHKREDCGEGFVCSLNQFFKARCIEVPDQPPFEISFPFESGIPVKCMQGNSVTNRSHFFDNILFSVDLHSLPTEMPAKILAAHDGIAYIFNNCNYRENHGFASNDRKCGLGYGNYVIILHESGYASIYAHLSEIFVKDRQTIKNGDILGLEGASGSSGLHHLHFGVFKGLYPVVKTPKQSVPFSFKALYSDKEHPEIIPSLNIRWDNGYKPPYICGIRDCKDANCEEKLIKKCRSNIKKFKFQAVCLPFSESAKLICKENSNKNGVKYTTIYADPGTPLIAPVAGKISLQKLENKSYYVSITGNKKVSFVPVKNLKVIQNQKVQKGEIIGTLYNTGLEFKANESYKFKTKIRLMNKSVKDVDSLPCDGKTIFYPAHVND